MTVRELHHLAVHFGIATSDLFHGADHAVAKLSDVRRAATLGGTQTTISGLR